MENTLLFDIVRIYYECGILTALFFVIVSQGAVSLKDIFLLILFWPAPLLIMIFGLKGSGDE
jgi:hypothetical protein